MASLLTTSTSHFDIYDGDADPNGVVTARLGSIYIRTDVAFVYQNTDGATAWIAMGTSAVGGGWTDDGTNVRLTTVTDTVSVGSSTAPAGGIKMRVVLNDAVTNAVTVPFVVDHETTGLAAVGIGAGIQLRMHNTAAAIQAGAQISSTWSNATAGAEASRIEFATRTGGAALLSAWRMDGNGNLTMLLNAAIAPTTDNTGVVGSSTLRFSSMAALLYTAYAAAGDAVPAMALGSTTLAFGPGGAGVQDTKLARTGTAAFQITANTIVPFVDGADFGAAATRFDLFTREFWGLPVEKAFADSPYTLTTGDYVLFVNTAGGNVVVNLPSAASSRGRFFIVKKRTNDANTVTVTRAGADTIDGAATAVLAGGTFGSMTLVGPTTGTDWALV